MRSTDRRDKIGAKDRDGSRGSALIGGKIIKQKKLVHQANDKRVVEGNEEESNRYKGVRGQGRRREKNDELQGANIEPEREGRGYPVQ